MSRSMMVVGLVVLVRWSSPCGADVVKFEDADAWWDAAGEVTTIDFTEFEHGDVLTDEYSDLGLTFGDPGVFVLVGTTFPLDNHGIRSAAGGFEFHFDGNRIALGFTYPGFFRVRLFDGDRLVGGPTLFNSDRLGQFGGLVSSEAFDRVTITGLLPDDPEFLGDIYFGPVVPAPAAWLVVAGGLVAGRGGRRRTAVPAAAAADARAA